MTSSHAKIEYGATGKVTTDAVHRHFLKQKPVNVAQNDDFRNENDISSFFYCQQCNSNIQRTEDKRELKFHFQSKKHEPVSNCVYCKKPVYEYVCDKRIEIYHYCNYND